VRVYGGLGDPDMDEGAVLMAGTAGPIGDRRRSLLTVVGLIAALVFVAVALGRPAAAQAVGELSYDGCFGAGAGCTFVAGGPLTGADSVAVSPNGGSVYVASKGIHLLDGAVAHFFVGAQGRLGYDGCVSDDGSGGRCADIPGSTTPLAGASAVAVSPNGASVYTANDFGPTLAHFFANPSQGQLSWDGCVSNDGSGGTCGDVPGTGSPLTGPDGVAVSPNGASVYASSLGGTLSHLFANPSQGQISWDGCVSNDGSGGTCADIPGSGIPFQNLRAVAVSPNGASVYAVSDGTLSHLFANPTQGQISWDGCVTNDGSGGTCLDVPGGGTPFSNLVDVAVSPNGASVYAVSSNNGTVSHLFANPAQGQLSWDGCVSDDGSGGTCGDVPGTGTPLAGASGVAVSPDGRSLYVASATASSISSFSVAPQGQLTFQGCLSDNAIPGCVDPPGEPLKGADAVAVSPDGGSVYVTGFGNGTVAHFFRTQSSGGGGGGGGGGGAGGGGGGTSNPTRTLTAKIDNQLITVVTSLQSACVAKSGSLSATLTSSAIPGSKATKLRSTGAAFSIDRGVRHVHHRTRHRHGKKVVVTTITYTPNHTVGRLPANVSLKLAGLSSRSHAFKVKVSYHETVKRHGHHQTVTVSKTLSLTFKVC
jgi:DNA-binding beta-propeller fold protein YncE